MYHGHLAPRTNRELVVQLVDKHRLLAFPVLRQGAVKRQISKRSIHTLSKAIDRVRPQTEVQLVLTGEAGVEIQLTSWPKVKALRSATPFLLAG